MDKTELIVGQEYVITWPYRITVTLEHIDLDKDMAFGRAKDGVQHGRNIAFFEVTPPRNLEDEVDKLTETVTLLVKRIKQIETRFGPLN